MSSSLKLRNKIIQEAKSELARRDFWYYCKLIAPDFYKDSRPHLKLICETLQALFEGRIYRNNKTGKWEISPVIIVGEEACKRLIMNIPPQHGKSRTLINFANWIFGKNPAEKIITCSYNDSTASDFSRYTRDGIQTQKNGDEIVYSDIFPKTKIKQGNSSFEKWALDGYHFSYLGAGVGGSITSKGGTILIVDDPVKGAEEALNDNHLEKIWTWYTSTFLSRVSAERGEPIEIVNMTRWSKKDICGRILSGEESNDWFILKLEAYNADTDQMLCDDLLSKKRYESLKKKVLDTIFRANYHQEPIDVKSALFTDLRTFKTSSLFEFESSIAYIDVADEGSDHLAAAVARNIKSDAYITDVVFNQNNADITLVQCAEMLKRNDVRYCRVESNAMGAMFARSLQKMVPNCKILQAHSTANKHTRILMDAWFIQKNFMFLDKSIRSNEYQKFIDQVCDYTKDGKSKKDDAPDCLSGLAMFIRVMLSKYYA